MSANVFGGLPVVSHDRIQVDPRVMLGKPVIKGTRVTVELILRKMGEGADERSLLDEYPQLTSDDVRAAVRYAADVLALEDISVDHLEP